MSASCGTPPRRTCENRRAEDFAAERAASKCQLTVEAVMPSRLDPPDMPRLDVLDEEFGENAAAVLHARRNAGHCGAGPGRHRGARLCLVERGWAAAVRAAIGGYRAEKRAARGSAGGDRVGTGRARRAEERCQGDRGSTTSGGACHRDHEGGRGGLATRCSAPVLVLEPGDVGFG